MAEGDDQDDSQKTEEPSARKLEEARKRGQIVYSREVTNWVMLFAITLLVVMMAPGIMLDLQGVLKSFISESHAYPTDAHGLMGVGKMLFWRVMGQLLVPFGILMVVGVLAAYVQTGPIFTAEPIKPDLKKISIMSGFQRLFSMRSISEFVKSLVKLVVISAAIYLALSPYFPTIDHFVGQDIGPAMFDLEDLFVKMMVAALIVLFVLAIADYMYQRHDFMQKMRMSKQELKEEYKQTEGDPQVKGRLRALREQKARQRMMQAVPEADVVITNPTHYAVALKYNSAEMDAPVMVAKGADLVAQRIRDIANENKVPLVENPALARALFDSMEIEQTIPHEHFKAVAEVISYVFKLRGKKL
ncbi:MAG TPA: flagellar biosynthesis protein FlhB [Patescibacteria group bacterium]|nr:flagellar biosynthesis protein FlhB [Patescibacteria group bacterium]